jgi:pimeloyl-ACP methyl ester carboxylesterase
VRAVAAPTLLVFADRDVSTLEHAVEMFRMHRDAQLAVVPGSDHISLVEKKGNVLNPIPSTSSTPQCPRPSHP